MKDPAQRARRMVLLLGSLLLLVSSIPVLQGLANTPEGSSFLGVPYNAHDASQYLAWIEEARRGGWLFHDPYTSEPQRAVFFHPLFLVLGKIALVTGLGKMLLYNLTRLLAAAFLLWAVFRFTAHFFSDPRARLWAFTLIATSAGLGWLRAFPSLEGAPWLHATGFRAASSTFWSLYLYPLFSLSIAFLLLCLDALLRFFAEGRWRHALGAGIYLLLLITLHPFDLVLLLAIPPLAALVMLIQRAPIERRWIYAYALMGAITAPYVLYLLLVLMRDPIFSAASKVSVYKPTIAEMLALYGLLVPLALSGVPRLWKQRSPASALLLSWIVAVPLLSYLPVGPKNIPARLIEGYHVALCLAAAGPLLALLDRIPARVARHGVAALVIAALSLGNIFVLYRDASAMRRPSPPYIVPHQLEHALHWLGARGRDHELVLASRKVALLVPGYSGKRSFSGHYFLTLDYRRKQALLRSFFQSSTSDAGRRIFMKKHGIRYVFHTPFEAALGSYDPGKSSYLRQIYGKGPVRIFEYMR